MRLAFDATALLGARTGVGVFAAALLEGLAARRDEGIDVIAYGVTWRGRDRLPAVVPAGVRVSTRPMAAQPLRQAWRRVDWPPIDWWIGRVDVVHGPNFVVPPSRHAATLVSVHDLTPVRFPELSTPDTLQYPGLLRRALRRGAHVHTGSQFVAAEIVAEFGPDPARVHVVHDGVAAVAGGDLAAGRHLAGADRYVLALGTIEPRKELPVLVRAFDAIAADDPDVRLVVAGPDGWGTEAYTAAVLAAAHRDRIVRVGYVSDNDRANLLAGASLFAYPSRYEGFGLPPLEAMTAGVPVVTTTAGSLPEVVGDAALLVPPGDEAALAGAIDRALNDADLAASLATAGRTRAARFSWDETVDGLVAVYRSLA